MLAVGFLARLSQQVSTKFSDVDKYLQKDHNNCESRSYHDYYKTSEPTVQLYFLQSSKNLLAENFLRKTIVAP